MPHPPWNTCKVYDGTAAGRFDKRKYKRGQGAERTSLLWSLWPPLKWSSRLWTNPTFPPRRSIKVSTSCTTSNEYAHLSPGYQDVVYVSNLDEFHKNYKIVNRTFSPPVIRPGPASISIPCFHKSSLVVEQLESVSHRSVKQHLRDIVWLSEFASENVGRVVIV